MEKDTPANQPEEKEPPTNPGQAPESAPAAGKQPPAESPDLSRKTVLVVDDVAVMRLRLRPVLEDAGYRVFEAEDGEKALAVIQQNDSQVDIVITDITMPVMDGLEFIRKLRLELNLANLPVIVCTARGEISVVRKAKLLGVQGFLVKPITKPTLLAAIKREVG